jgi:hypothetical protein
MSKRPSHAWFLPTLMIVLAAWGLLLAVGALLGPEFWQRPKEGEAPRPAAKRSFDVRKPLVVAGCVGLFVGGWGLALWLRQRRLAREESEDDEPPTPPES